MKFTAEKAKKRLFISLLCITYVIMLIVCAGVWFITLPGLNNINSHLAPAFAAAMIGILFLVGFGILGMLFGVKGWPLPTIFKKQTYKLLNVLYYIVLSAGKIIGIDRRRIEASYVAVSNTIVRNRNLKVPADRLLVVTPHCLQLHTCPHRITTDPSNCKRCGGCNIGDLVTLAEKIGFHFFVVTGGTLARQKVMEIRPQAVVAVACERDLASGIQDVYPIPSVGVMNIRPNGPCFNTKVDIEEFKRAIMEIIDLPESDLIPQEKEN
ncbi:hypothetical protein D081_1785 [Anaerovibrio sp. JC8]|uniref:DUF116 domain-containing protein n=1 Tax=Anaerovibrio sp. JC8 TaxID=1240085 RepID=UPI000A0BD243|nr:DUF116 domain-containing protein [Anaerovibrio sp. JC8]ORT99635.1 hypothetical protein D081_1785 [Anaerovibrio sp. JC8]